MKLESQKNTRTFRRSCLLLMLVSLIAVDASAKTHRDPAQRRAFQREHPCPATSKKSGKCPGYVVDHVVPLCAGGQDHASNMQWQTIAEAKIKDRQEVGQCRGR